MAIYDFIDAQIALAKTLFVELESDLKGTNIFTDINSREFKNSIDKDIADKIKAIVDIVLTYCIGSKGIITFPYMFKKDLDITINYHKKVNGYQYYVIMTKVGLIIFE
jgi:hypothetical protein